MERRLRNSKQTNCPKLSVFRKTNHIYQLMVMTIMGKNIKPKQFHRLISLTSADIFSLFGKKALRLCNSETEIILGSWCISHIQNFIRTNNFESWKPLHLLARPRWPAFPTSKTHTASAHSAWFPLLWAVLQDGADTSSTCRHCHCCQGFPGQGMSSAANSFGSWKRMKGEHHLQVKEVAALIAQWVQ